MLLVKIVTSYFYFILTEHMEENFVSQIIYFCRREKSTL
jgi:hypothetical protein